MSADMYDYARASRNAAKAHPEWRLGQAYFNTLEEVRPDLAKKLRGSPVDCFHLDFLIPDFLNVVWGLWDDEAKS